MYSDAFWLLLASTVTGFALYLFRARRCGLMCMYGHSHVHLFLRSKTHGMRRLRHWRPYTKTLWSESDMQLLTVVGGAETNEV